MEKSIQFKILQAAKPLTDKKLIVLSSTPLARIKFFILIPVFIIISDISLFSQCDDFFVDIITDPPYLSYCPGDTVAAIPIVTGGTPPYIFEWHPGQNTDSIEYFVAPTGWFDVCVIVYDANGCSFTTCEHIKPQLWDAWAYNVGMGCPGGTNELFVDLGNSSHNVSYLWSTGETTNPIFVPDPGTYTVTVTELSTGCEAVLEAEAYFTTNPEPEISGPDVICPGETPTLYLSGGSSWWDYVWGPGGETTSYIIVDTPGTYSVTVTDQIHGCVGSASYEIQTSTTTPLQMDAPSGLCDGGTGTISIINASDYVFHYWNTTETTSSITVTTPGTYSVTSTDANGCQVFGQVTIEDLTTSPLSIFGDDFICPNQSSVQLSVDPFFDQYLWSTGETTSSIAVTEAGTYTVTVTDGSNCTVVGSHQIVLNPAPDPVINQDAPSCQNNPVTLSVSGNGGPFQGYLWSTGETTQQIQASQTGTYSVTVSNNFGCTGASEGFFVSINPGTEASISPLPGNCDDGFVLLEATGGLYFQWSTGETTPLLAVFNDGTYTVTVSDDNGCTSTATATITLPEIPTVEISGPIVLCDGENATLSASPGFTSYLWSNGQNTQDIQVAQGGIYSVTVTDEFGCSANSQHDVSFIPLPQPQINGPDVLCNGSSATLELNQAFDQILWSTGQTTPSISVSVPDTYFVTVTSNNGCQAFDSFILAELTPPTVNITGPTSICSGSSTTLSVPDIFNEILWNTGQNTSAIQVSQSGTYAVTVIDNNGCSGTAIHSLETGESLIPEITIQETGCNGTALLDAGGGFDSYLWSNGATTPQITVNTNGAFTVSVSDVNGCFGSNSVDVIIPEPPQVTITGPAEACNGSSIVLTADPGFTTYQWSNGETSESITLDVSSSATYSITVTNSNGCPATEVHDIQIYPLPTVETSGPGYLCQGSSDTLSAIGSFQDIQWSTGETTSEIQVSENGNYQVIVTDQNGCSSTVTHQVVTGDSLSVAISLLSPECSGIANLEAEAGFSSYHWSTGDSTQNIQISQSGNYSLTVSDTNGCSAESALDYEQMTVPEVMISGPEFICTGFSDTLLATGNYQEILWNTGDTEANIIISLPGVYQATVTDSNGCTALAEHMVEVGNSLDPQIILTGPDCEGNAIISAHDGFSMYTWSNGNSSHEFSVNTDGTYSVTVTDENGCTGTGSVDLNIPLPPQVAIEGPTEACEGIEEFLTADSGFVNYLWSTGATTESISVNYSDTYSVTVTDINGCTATTSVDFESLPLPSVQITGPEHLCNGDSAMLSISGTFDQIQWNTGDSNSEVLISQEGTYNVIVTDANGCMASTEHMVEVEESPIPQIILTGPDCDGNAMISIDEGYSSYLWSNGSSSNELAVNSSGTYFVTVTDGNGCTGSGSVDINIPAPIQVAISGPAESCEGVSEFLSADPGFASYLWSTGATTETITVNDADTYSVTVTDDNGCTATVSMDFESLPLPEVQIAGPEHLCNGDSAMLSISGTFDQIQWNTGDSNSEVLISQAGTYAVIVTDANGCMASTEHMVEVEESPIPQIILTGPDCDGNAIISVDEGYSSYLWSNGSSSNEFAVNLSGTYSVTVTNENGCVGTGSLDLNIPAPIQVAISGPTEACEGVSEFLSADPGFASYLWSTGATTETISVNNTDTYSLTVTDDNGCTATVSLDFESLPLPEAQIAGPEFICANDLAVLSVEGSFSQVVWNNGQIGNILEISQPGTYSALVTAANGCESSAMTDVFGYPNVDFELEATPTCKDEANGTIEVKNLSGSAPFLFYLSNYEPQASPLFTGLSNGTYSILVMDDNGCTMELPLEIREVPPLEITVSDQEISCEQSSVLLQPEVISGDLANLQWSWSTGSIDPWIEVEDVGRYVVEVSDKCSVQEYGIQVNYAAELLGKNLFYVPNVFSPNNDGVNDYFQVFSKPDVNILEFELRVFDRWGEQLFVTNEVDGKWDGVFKNVRLQPAVFVWYIIARVDQCGMREFEIKDKGDVLILR